MKKIFTLFLLLSFGLLMAANTAKVTCPTATAAVSNPTLCSGQSTGIQLQSNVANTTFTWTVVQTGVVGASSGSGNTISHALTTTTVNPGQVTYTITPFADSCTGNPITVTITVYPRPAVTTSSSTLNMCTGGTTNIILSSNTPGTTYAWTINQNGLTGASAVSNDTTGFISQTLSTVSNLGGQVVYGVTPSFNGCFEVTIYSTVI